MHRRIVDVLLLLFLAAIGVDWPNLPYNAQLADLIFIPLAALVVALPQARWTWRWPDLAVAIYLLGAVPGIAVSADRTHSVMEFGREIYLAIVYLVVAMAARHGMARTIGKGLAFGGAILSVAGLLFVIRQTIGASPWPPMGEVMALPYIGDTLRLRALTASEAMLACVLTAAIPFAIAMCTRDRIRGWCATGAAMIAAAALTFSHAIAGFAVATVVAAWPLLKERKYLRNLAVAAAVVVFLVLNFAATVSIRSITGGDSNYTDRSVYHYAVDEGEMRVGNAVVTFSVMSYARIKQVAWRAFLEHPIAGLGLDQFHTATVRAYDEGALPLLYREIDPHSALFGRLAECGAIGGVTLLMLWAAWAAMARETSAHYLGYAAAAALAGLIVSSLNADIMNFRFLWVLAGLVRGLQASTPSRQAPTSLSPGDQSEC